MNPKVSIIVPVYNVEKYIRRCLDSIAAQTFTDWECICVDDGTPDGSGKICDEYAEKDSRFRVIHKENGGVSSARNAGLDATKGEWVAFVDSDDWIEKETYETAYKTAIEKSADLVQWNVLNEYYCKTMEDTFFSIGALDKSEVIKLLLTGEIPGYVFNKMFKQKMFSDGKVRFEERITMCEDLFFCITSIFHSRKFASVDKCMYHYNLANDLSATGRFFFNERQCNSLESVCIAVRKELGEMGISSLCADEINFFVADKKKWLLLNAPLSLCKKYIHLAPECNKEFRSIVNKEDAKYRKMVLCFFSHGLVFVPWLLNNAFKFIMYYARRALND